MTELEVTPQPSRVRRYAAASVAALAVVGLAVTAGLVFASGSARRTPRTGVPPIATSEAADAGRAQAIRRAVLILRTAPMVAGAVGRDSPPVRALDQPASIPGAQHVQRTRFWTASGTVASTIAYLHAHPPAGMTSSGSGSAGGPGVPPNASLYFQSTEISSLLYNVFAYKNGVAVRADARVLWAAPRDPADTVPSSVTALDVLVVRKNPQLHQGAPTVHRTLSGSAARALVDFVNRLPRAIPTGYVSCPAELGGEKRLDQLVFHSPGNTSRLLVNMVGCSTATLWVGHRRGIELSSSYSGAVVRHRPRNHALDRASGELRTSPGALEELFGQGAVSGQRVGVRLGQELHGNVVGARVEVRADAGRDRRRVASSDERIDQRVAARAGQVGVAPPESAQVGRVVDEAEVGLVDLGTADRPSTLRDRSRAPPSVQVPARRPRRGSRARSWCAPAERDTDARRQCGRAPAEAPSGRARRVHVRP